MTIDHCFRLLSISFTKPNVKFDCFLRTKKSLILMLKNMLMFTLMKIESIKSIEKDLLNPY
jgi:hypothetical protein